jgi:hypothetical protein
MLFGTIFYLGQKNLPRKKRRKLEAQREVLENERDDDDNQVSFIFHMNIYFSSINELK